MREGHSGRNAPDAVDVFSDLVRVCTLKLGELRGAFDLEEYLVTAGRNDLDRCKKKRPSGLSAVSPINPVDKQYAYFHIDRVASCSSCSSYLILPRFHVLGRLLGCQFWGLGHFVCDSKLRLCVASV